MRMSAYNIVGILCGLVVAPFLIEYYNDYVRRTASRRSIIKWAELRKAKVETYMVSLRPNQKISTMSDVYDVFGVSVTTWPYRTYIRYIAAMYRKYLDRDLIKAIRNRTHNFLGKKCICVYASTCDELASSGDSYFVIPYELVNLWSLIPASHIAKSREKVQHRLEMLANIKRIPMRRKLLYMAIVLECDTPIIEAIYHHTISSIVPEKN